jgi:hypothetical protein
MKINEVITEASALGSFLRGAGATQSADAADAYALAQQRNPQAIAPKKPRKPKNTIPTVDKITPTAPDEPYSIGGQKLDPNNPKDKAIIDKLKAAQA